MIKEFLKRQPWLFRRVQLHKRQQRIKLDQPQWQQIVEAHADWQTALTQAQGGPKILVATSVGGDPHLTGVESLLSAALTLRGAEVHVLLCDGILPACFWCDVSFYPNLNRFLQRGPQGDFCQDCFSTAHQRFQELGVRVHRYSDWLSAADRQQAEAIATQLSDTDDIAAYQLDGVAVGEHALAGALRFFARADLKSEPNAEPVLRRYFQAALLTTYAIRKLLQSIPFECAVFNHGIYVPQGLIGEVARQQHVRVVNWNAAYRRGCFIFSHHDTYHHQLMSEPVSNWEDLPWTSVMENKLMDYLKSRWQGTQDWIWFHERPQLDLQAIAQEIGVDFSRPCIGLLTNVMWDAQLHYPANAFPNMLTWVLDTIRYFSQRPDLQLLIRIHPAEIRGTLRSRQPIAEEIQKAFPTLPPNVFIIPPESRVSTYAAMLQCNAVIIYGTKTGVELTSMGIPVIVAGEAWVRNKGITLDASSIEEYFQLLAKLPLTHALDAVTLQRARKYAYHFFFRRMIPLEFMVDSQIPASFKLQVNQLQDLLPGHSPGLDLICQGILQGSEFVYPHETLAFKS